MAKKKPSLFGQKLKRLFFSPSFLLPSFVGGLFYLVQQPTPALVCIGAAAAFVLSRLTWGRRRLNDQAMQDALRKQERAYQTRLRSVRSLVRRDRDPRSSSLIKRLKDVFERLWELTPDPFDSGSANDELYLKIAELYESSLGMLERSYEFWTAARSVATERARHEMLNSRDGLLDQVETSIDHLDATLDSLQTAQINRNDEELTDRNSRLQRELQQGLEVARAVEERMDSLEQRLKQIERE